MKELRDLVNLLKKQWLILGLGALTGFILATFVFANQKSLFSFTVSLVHDGVIAESAQAQYQYDGYYYVETSRLFNDRLGRILRDSSLNYSFGNAFGSSVKISRVDKLSFGDWQVIVSGKPDTLNEYSVFIEDKVSQMLGDIAKDTGEYAAFKVKVSYQGETETKPLEYYLSLGTLLGFLFGAFSALLRDYFKGH